MTNAQCPLCHSPARYKIVEEGRRFTCGKCKEFIIDTYSEDVLAKYEIARSNFSNEARAVFPDSILVFCEPEDEDEKTKKTTISTYYIDI